MAAKKAAGMKPQTGSFVRAGSSRRLRNGVVGWQMCWEGRSAAGVWPAAVARTGRRRVATGQ